MPAVGGFSIEEMHMQLRYAITSSLERHLPGAAKPHGGRVAHIAAARNEHVNAQLFLQADERVLVVLSGEPHLDWTGDVLRVRVEASPLTSAGRGKGSIPSPTMRFQHAVPDEFGRPTLDALLLDEARLVVRRIGPGNVCPIWLSAFVPPDARPGVYEGTIAFYAQHRFDDETKVGEAAVAITVARTRLPEPKDFGFHLDLWQHPASIARLHRVPLWSDAHFSLIDAYYRPLGALGQKMITVIASDVPWSGQGGPEEVDYTSSVWEHSMIPVRKTATGRMRCDFRNLDRYLRTAMKAGVGPELEVIGLLGVWREAFGHPIADHADNVRVRTFDEGAGVYRYITKLSDFEAYVKQVVAHLDRKGLLGKTYICSDEPADSDLFGRSLAVLRGIEPRLKFRVAANHREFMETFFDEVADWVPYIDAAAADDILDARIAERVRRAGGRFFWYVCCGPEYPNNFLRSPLLESRLIPWLTRAFNFDGFLRWAYCCFPSDPWNRPHFRFPAGDMGFVYPGAHGGPVLSPRYEALRAGIQDYELLRLAEKKGKKEAVAKAIRKVVKARDLRAFQPGRATPPEKLYTLKDADVAAARKLVLDF